MNMTMNTINDFVTKFLENTDMPACDSVEYWMSDETQKALQTLFKKSKKTNKNKDPTKPKKGKSAYIFFCQDKRSKVKEDHPEMSPREITSELGRLWSEIKDNKRMISKYTKMSKVDKGRYDEAMKEYTPLSDEEIGALKKPRKKRTSSKKDPSKPKRGKSAYLFFCADERPRVKEDHPEMSPKEITTELGRRWQEIKNDEEAISEYVELAQDDKERYEEEMKEYTPHSEESE